MYRYRNANTGDVVELDQRSARLEHLANWERIAADEAGDAPTDPEAAGALAAVVDDTTLTHEQIVARLQRADATALLALADEYEIDLPDGVETPSDLADNDEAAEAIIAELADAIVEDRGTPPVAPPEPIPTGLAAPAPATTEQPRLTGKDLDDRVAALEIDAKTGGSNADGSMNADEKRAAIAKAEAS